jgi:hypothetical protein
LRGVGELREIALDDPRLGEGWWAVERDGPAAMRRWTDGAAVLPLPALSGPTMLEVHLGQETLYALPTEPVANLASERRAA